MQSYIFTDNGNRDYNEDSVGSFITDELCGFFLADGLGGHGGGQFASAIAVDAGKFCFEKSSGSVIDALNNAFLAAQSRIIEDQKQGGERREMKTTFVALGIKDNKASWGHVGDSRLYLFRDGTQFARTLDHSMPQLLVEIGKLKESKIRNHPDRSKLMRAMGDDWGESIRYEIDATDVQLYSGDAFLLCSDGFWELIEEKAMLKLLKKSDSAQEWVESMAETVRKNGRKRNMDNYSAVAVFV